MTSVTVAMYSRGTFRFAVAVARNFLQADCIFLIHVASSPRNFGLVQLGWRKTSLVTIGTFGRLRSGQASIFFCNRASTARSFSGCFPSALGRTGCTPGTES